MQTILFTAVGVGGATVLGAILGFFIKSPNERFNDALLSFAGGVMLASALVSLLLPALEYGKFSILFTVAGIFLGALCIRGLNKFVPKLYALAGVKANQGKLNKVLLFVLAIAIHNLPEGIVTGVGFGIGNTAQAFSIAFGIALQNVPEGFVIIAPMVSAGVSKPRTFLIAVITGIIEVAGTFLGYFAIRFVTKFLSFALAFAGGTMLYVVANEMLPDAHIHGNGNTATFSFLLGIAFMLVFNFLIA